MPNLIVLSVKFSYCYAEHHCAECRVFLLLCWMSLSLMSSRWMLWHPYIRPQTFWMKWMTLWHYHLCHDIHLDDIKDNDVQHINKKMRTSVYKCSPIADVLPKNFVSVNASYKPRRVVSRLIYMPNFSVPFCIKLVHFREQKFIVCLVNMQA